MHQTYYVIEVEMLGPNSTEYAKSYDAFAPFINLSDGSTSTCNV